jgi:hypothetical protein
MTEERKAAGGNAFPDQYYPGLTIRDYFAGQALAGIARTAAAELTATARNGVYAYWTEQAYAIADAMLDARAKPAATPPAQD